ncbi:MAG: PEP-CTERM sorting domain-containing protein [Akkermansia sp.]
MMKTLFTFFALAAAATAGDITLSVMPGKNFSVNDNIVKQQTASEETGTPAWVNLGFGSVTLANLQTDFTNAPTLQNEGYHFFTANGTDQDSSYKSFYFQDGIVKLTGRKNALNQDVFYSAVTSVSSILRNQYQTSDLTSLTLTLKGQSDNSVQAGWGLYRLDTSGNLTAISEIMNGKDLSSSTVGTNEYTSTITLSQSQLDALQDGDKLVALFRVKASGGLSLRVKDLTYAATTAPEPTTATLSLLALVGLAARRRRKAA